MTDTSKGGKFDFQKIISDVKSMITPTPIPEANKDDPIPYLLSELGKQGEELAKMQQKQSDVMAKMNDTIGSLYSQIMASRGESNIGTTKTDKKVTESDESSAETKPE